MLSNITYYELLGCSPDVDSDEIKQYYTDKIYELTKHKVTNLENYQTAYYILSDPIRRKEYDDSIGIFRRNHIPIYKRLILSIARGILTLLDMLTEFMWSFLIVIILVFAGYCYYFYKKNNYLSMHNIIDSIDPIYILISFGVITVSLIAYLFHPTIRRLNRKLKYALRKYQ